MKRSSLFRRLVFLLTCTMLLGLIACTQTAAAENAEGAAPKELEVSYTTITRGEDWGPAIPRIVLHFDTELDAASVTPDKFTVTSVQVYGDVDYETYLVGEPYEHVADRVITNAYLSDEEGNPQQSGKNVTLEMEIGPDRAEGSPFAFDFYTYQNYYVEGGYRISLNAPLTASDGQSVTMTPIEETTPSKRSITLLADDFDTTGTYTYTYGTEHERSIDLTYASWFPKADAAEASTPLIIWLHGMGEGGTDPYVTLLGNKVTSLITDTVQQCFGDTGAAVLAPQCPTMWMDTNGQFTMNMDDVEGSQGQSFYTEALMSLITEFINAHPAIDKTRVYIGGCSNGGYMTMNLLVTYPGAFAAAYPVCEPYDNSWLTEEKLQTLVDLPIWLTAAKTDDVVVIYEGEWEEDEPYLYRVAEDAQSVYNYSNALYDRLVKAGARDVHFSLFDKVTDSTGLYKDANGEPYEYNGHWSWIYTLNNQCTDTVDGEEITIFEWMSRQQGEGIFPEEPLEKEVYPAVTFYLVRHGETQYNVEEKMQGWCDSPLTDNGVAMAKKLGEGLAEIPFVAAYSSTSGRAVDTAKLVLDGRGLEIHQSDDLREMYYGSVEGQSSEGVYTEENFFYRFEVGFDDLGGETWEELGIRMRNALNAAARENCENGGNVFVSTHGMSILGVLYATVPYDPRLETQGALDNCSVTILEWDNGVFTLTDLNDTSYLN